MFMKLHTQVRDEQYKALERSVNWDSKESVLIICDVWDKHWCVGYTHRTNEIAPAINIFVKAVRNYGITIIHAPNADSFYEDHPSRQKAKSIEDKNWSNELPIITEKQSIGEQLRRLLNLRANGVISNPSCEHNCRFYTPAWTRQHEAIEICPDRDFITSSRQEIFNIMELGRINNVFFVGGALNICLLGNQFGIRQMSSQRRNILVVRDMIDTFDSHSDPLQNNHFKHRETIIEYIEKEWCPTILSTDITGQPPFQFEGKRC